ncbi:response regulator transcription factor [Campylobacter sputorum]|uniref:response regulator transcription factor n=1 Tax=Campylobacter sputorum TaxID=206 RepID=UPI000B784FA3|nr:winged helix-turn-helix domain-containing protein [Campylobacter sputorum]ASM37252.1 transcriptional regulator [Campylobacter sputorum bv. faecalis CCUG 20703]
MKVCLMRIDSKMTEVLSFISKTFKISFYSFDAFFDIPIILDHKIRYDAFVLNIDDDYKSGIEFVKSLKESSIQAPVIVILNEISADLIKELYCIGCDDFILKTNEITSDAAQILFKILTKYNKSLIYHIKKGVYFNVDLSCLFVGKNEIYLGRKESKLLEILLRHRRKVVTMNQIEIFVWGNEIPRDEAFRSLVRQLRSKVPFEIKNVKGIGYKIP